MKRLALVFVLVSAPLATSCVAVQDWWEEKAGPAVCQTVGPIKSGGAAVASLVLPPIASNIVSTAWSGVWDMLCGVVEVAGSVITDPVGTAISPITVVIEVFSDEEAPPDPAVADPAGQ